MIGPKSAHLVERAAERLLQAGVLEGSAAQLLEPDRLRPPSPVPPPARQIGTEPPPAPATAPSVSPVDVLMPDRAPVEVEEPVQRPEPSPRPIIEMAALERAGMFDWSRGRSRISEEFRLAQRQLLRAAFTPTAEAGVSNLVMVTSARPGEGKTFTAVNLAGSVALQGDHHVLLIDSDSKRDSICQALGLADAPGVLDLAANPNLDPNEVILRTEIEHLSLLPVGQERGRSSELFASRDMTQLIQRLGRRYSDRLLVLDAAPCLSTSDPAALAPVVGQILFVVEAERTQREEVEAALDLIQACPLIMLLLNKVQVTNRYTFGAYSNYYSS
jgi:receptor protein-tyrosine kinase